MEVIAEGDRILYKVNGVVVNEAFDCKPSAGKLLLQTELAEMFVRRFELWPIGQAPFWYTAARNRISRKPFKNLG